MHIHKWLALSLVSGRLVRCLAIRAMGLLLLGASVINILQYLYLESVSFPVCRLFLHETDDRENNIIHLQNLNNEHTGSQKSVRQLPKWRLWLRLWLDHCFFLYFSIASAAIAIAIATNA